ncbi:MAG: glucose-1-phosphate adenylyltransferase [Anaerolineae bacterium]|nr:glucose-1-phosphate adenylyltransferase [Anaerolineae bacterium]
MAVLTLILAGGAGSRLSILGEKRAKPAVPFAGKYRIIDFPLSNAVNSDLYRIAVLTQFRPHSLMEHIGIGDPWDLNRRPPNGLHIWQPYRGRTDQDWYRGTADALYQNRGFIQATNSDTLLILSGDHIYKQDYRDLLRFHQNKGADLTVAVMNVRPEETHRFGIMTVDAGQKITRFAEKPKQSESTLASMGIYVFNTRFLLDLLEQDALDKESAHDFGKNIIPQIVQMGKAYAYPFMGYWVDVGTIQSYWETSMELLGETPGLDLYDKDWVIHTRSEERPPVKCLPPGELVNSIASNGCFVQGTVINSVLSPGVRVEKGAVVRDSVIMNDTVIRANAMLDRCILDKEIEVGARVQLGVGDGDTPNALEPANINTGITIVGKRAHVPAGAVIGRNCRIDPATEMEDYEALEVPSGGTISKKPRG